jgi:dTDP-4-amino-4,6-dideoxygalactose transaminase
VRLPAEAPGVKHAYHLFVVQLRLERLRRGRRGIYDELRARKVGVNVHYIPIHLHPYYRRQFGYRPGDYPRAEAYYASALSLPLYPKMTEEEIDWVILSLRDVLAQDCAPAP